MIASTDLVVRPRGARGLRPTLTVSAGYTQRAIGPAFTFDEPYVTNEDGTYIPFAVDPIEVRQPRSATAGYAVQAGLVGTVGGRALHLVDVDVAVEAEAELAFRDESSEPESARVVGRLRLADALTGSSDDASVVGRRGVRLTLGEAVRLSVGRAEYGSIVREGAERDRLTSWGAGLDVAGAARLWASARGDNRLAALASRYELALDIASGAFSVDGRETVRYRLGTLTAGVRF